MNKLQNLLPIGFVLSVFLTACNDRDPVEAATKKGRMPESPVTARAASTPTLPNMPAPAAPEGPASRDSAATKPLATMTKAEESASMPEALQGNNHSSPALDPPNRGAKSTTSPAPAQDGLKKSSAYLPKAKKVIWI